MVYKINITTLEPAEKGRCWIFDQHTGSFSGCSYAHRLFPSLVVSIVKTVLHCGFLFSYMFMAVISCQHGS